MIVTDLPSTVSRALDTSCVPGTEGNSIPEKLAPAAPKAKVFANVGSTRMLFPAVESNTNKLIVFVPDEPKLELVTGCNIGGWFASKTSSPLARAAGRPLISSGFASPLRNPTVFACSPAFKFAGVPGNPVPVYDIVGNEKLELTALRTTK